MYKPTAPPRKKRVSGPTIAAFMIVMSAYFYIYLRVVTFDGELVRAVLTSLGTIFVSILMQAFPFMLIGLLISSAMHVFVSDDTIIKIFPARLGLGFVTALFAGIFLPVCECAIVPVTTGLIKKGVPIPVAFTFMLAAPIINPIVIVSTLYAFPGSPSVAVMRVGFGLFIALAVGLCLRAFQSLRPGALSPKAVYRPERLRLKPSCSCGCGHTHAHAANPSTGITPPHTHAHRRRDKTDGRSLSQKLEKMLLHAGNEFFSVGKYLIIGAFFTSVIQLALPQSVFLSLGGTKIVSLAVMMATAFLFSACSTSDAFIAKSFASRLPMAGIMGFMVYGPMMDLKNILMLLSVFKKRFVFGLALLITAGNLVFLTALVSIFIKRL